MKWLFTYPYQVENMYNIKLLCQSLFSSLLVFNANDLKQSNETNPVMS